MIDLSKEKLIDVNNLRTYFHTEEGTVKAVDGVSFEIYPGETLGVVGESGCGKSVTSRTIMGLIGHEKSEIVDGEVYFKGENLLNSTCLVSNIGLKPNFKDSESLPCVITKVCLPTL